MSRRKPLDRDAVVQALDAQIMGLLAIKAMVLSVDDFEDEVMDSLGPEGPCPEKRMAEPHDVVWTRSFGEGDDVGMCRACGGEWRSRPDDLPGVSSPDPA